MAELRINVVTPESTVVDRAAGFVVLPMIDGEAGVYPNHSPVIGRLAAGELRVQSDQSTERFYIDGGTVQVLNNQVSVLTGRCVPAKQVNIVAAREALEQAERLPKDDPKSAVHRQKMVDQARAQIRVAEKV